MKAKSLPKKKEKGTIHWNGIILDISHEKQLEEEFNAQKQLLESSSRLASLGEISAGIGHEINTPLAVAMLKLEASKELIHEKLGEDSKILGSLRFVDDALERIAGIVRSLRYLARDQEEHGSRCCPVKVEVENCINLIGELYRNYGVKILNRVEDETLKISCSGGHFQQILLNLITNSKDALSGKEDPTVIIEAKQEGPKVSLKVIDNGPGIPKDIHDKIFQPFFTTKGIDKGTGIGLAMCRTLVENANGAIRFESDSTGTTFECKFDAA